ncbi:MAG: alpha/beta fold hydrolase, partial [Pseudomonadota bacterium]
MRVAVVAILVILGSVIQLELPRFGLAVERFAVGETPVTLRTRPGGSGPLVVVAHGFAGSQQMMEGYALTLARAGYQVASFDFQGHGRNPEPMSGDVTALEGTTQLLVEEVGKVTAALEARLAPEGVAYLGHSMATDVLVRAAEARGGVDAIVAISMYSEAVTAEGPKRLLIISGAGEPHLRRAAVAALRQVDPGAGEGETVASNDVVRRAVVAPMVEHVGVLQSRTANRSTARPKRGNSNWMTDPRITRIATTATR